VTIVAPLVLVDARNVMRSRWPNIPEDRFLELLHWWVEQQGAAVVSVFDGRAPGGRLGIHELEDALTVVGTGDESADDWIAEHAPELARDRGGLWLVTSDRELRRRVEGVVERSVGGGSFAGQLLALEHGRR
jgi:hypothetical protein